MLEQKIISMVEREQMKLKDFGEIRIYFERPYYSQHCSILVETSGLCIFHNSDRTMSNDQLNYIKNKACNLEQGRSKSWDLMNHRVKHPFPGLRTKPTTPRTFAEYLSHLRTLVGEGVRVTCGGFGILRFRSSWSLAKSRSSGEFWVQRCCFVRESTIPEGLRSFLHPDPCFTPEFSLEDFLEVLGVSVRHGGVPFFRL